MRITTVIVAVIMMIGSSVGLISSAQATPPDDGSGLGPATTVSDVKFKRSMKEVNKPCPRGTEKLIEWRLNVKPGFKIYDVSRLGYVSKSGERVPLKFHKVTGTRAWEAYDTTGNKVRPGTVFARSVQRDAAAKVYFGADVYCFATEHDSGS